MLLRQVFDANLAQYAYLLGCQRTKEALVIDPERDVDRYLDLAEAEGLTITAVAETHIHADFLSGARELAERAGAKLYLSDEGDADWKYEWARGGEVHVTLLEDGDTFAVGGIEVEAIHTPGHTPEHIAFLITDRGSGADEPMGIISGDFVFVGDVGRPDLLETAARVAGTMEPAARRLYGSLDEFVALPEYLQVWPGHGAGSACGKALGAVPESTVGYEKRFNAAIRAAGEGEEEFVRFILDGQPEPPMYFARMKRDNRLGVPRLGDLPEPRELTAGELGRLANRPDVAVIDTRADRSAFMARHLPGSLYAPLGRSFGTAVGSLLVDERTPIHLVVGRRDLKGAVRDLVRIGFDEIAGFAEPATLESWLAGGGAAASIEETDFEGLEERLGDGSLRVVDVRYRFEWDEGHIAGAIHAPWTRLPELEETLPRDGTLAVHCATGARSAVAAAFLARSGRRTLYVNGSWDLPASRPAPADRGATG